MRHKLALLAAIALVAGAIAADAMSPASPRKPEGITVATQGGALACPIAVTPKVQSLLHIANLSKASSRVRVSVIPKRGKTRIVPVSLAGSSIKAVLLDPLVRGDASAVVEYVGGDIVASHMIFKTEDPSNGIAEAPCVRTGGPDVLVMPARTFLAKAKLALFNPGSAPADVTVTLVSDGNAIRPERLARRVVAGRSRLDFDLEDYAFDAQTVVAQIHATTGRVVAEILQTSPSGIELLTGTEPASDAVAISGVSGEGARVVVMPYGRGRSSIGARLLTASASSAMRVPSAVAPDEGTSLPIPARSKGAPAAASLVSNVGAPLAAGSTWSAKSSGSSDVGSLPALQTARRWGVVAGMAGTGAINLLIAAADDAAANVKLTILSSGKRSERTVTVAAARLEAIKLGTIAGVYAVLVESDVPIVASLVARSSSPRQGLLVMGTAAIPLRAPEPVAPTVDHRAGVPAPLPT